MNPSKREQNDCFHDFMIGKCQCIRCGKPICCIAKGLCPKIDKQECDKLQYWMEEYESFKNR